jgi:hypothetical protein
MTKKSIHRLEAKDCDYKDVELPMKSVTDALEQSSVNETLSLRTTRFRPSQCGTRNETLEREAFGDDLMDTTVVYPLLSTTESKVQG